MRNICKYVLGAEWTKNAKNVIPKNAQIPRKHDFHFLKIENFRETHAKLWDFSFTISMQIEIFRNAQKPSHSTITLYSPPVTRGARKFTSLIIFRFFLFLNFMKPHPKRVFQKLAPLAPILDVNFVKKMFDFAKCSHTIFSASIARLSDRGHVVLRQKLFFVFFPSVRRICEMTFFHVFFSVFLYLWNTQISTPPPPPNLALSALNSEI